MSAQWNFFDFVNIIVFDKHIERFKRFKTIGTKIGYINYGVVMNEINNDI